jgi:hypothetical protein
MIQPRPPGYPAIARTLWLSAWWLGLAGLLCTGTAATLDSAPASQAPAAQRTSRLSMVKADCIRSIGDIGFVASAPARFSGGQWGIAAALAGGMALSFAADQPVRRFILENRTDRSRRLLQPFFYNGLGAVAAPVAAGMYVGGLAFSLPWLHETGRMELTALLLSAATTSIIKFVCGRDRPYLNTGNASFRWFALSNSSWSLPSGHVTTAFTLSAVLAQQIDNPFASVGLYGIAALTAGQRLVNDKHWFSDAVIGAVIGTAMGRAVARRPKVDKGETVERPWGVFPILASDVQGVGVRVLF